MKFTYEAKTKQGQLQNGVVDASSRDVAIDILQRNDLIIMKLKAESDKPAFARRINIFETVKSRDIVIFSRQISVLFGAKVPLVESLQILANQTSGAVFQDIILEVSKELEGGMALSQAMSKHPKAFSRFYISMIKSGEVSGKLEEVFNYLADSLERQYSLKSKVFNALIYPAVVLVVFIIIVILMFVYVLPKLKEIVAESGQELPIATKIIFAASDFMVHYGVWFLPIIIIGGGFGVRYFFRTGEGRFLKDKFLLRMPIFGDLFQKIALSRFSDSLGTLVSGGLPIVQAIEITADVVDNEEYRYVFMQTAEQVKKGFTISSSLKLYPAIIPPMVSQMIFVAEETGKLEEILKRVAKFYSEETSRTLDALVTLIEPLIVVVLAGFVFVLILAVLMPFYNLAAGGF